jgi:hypothetical protein
MHQRRSMILYSALKSCVENLSSIPNAPKCPELEGPAEEQDFMLVRCLACSSRTRINTNLQNGEHKM